MLTVNADQTVQQQLAEADKHGEGPASYQNYNNTGGASSEFGGGSQGWQNAVNASVVEHI